MTRHVMTCNVMSCHVMSCDLEEEVRDEVPDDCAGHVHRPEDARVPRDCVIVRVVGQECALQQLYF